MSNKHGKLIPQILEGSIWSISIKDAEKILKKLGFKEQSQVLRSQMSGGNDRPTRKYTHSELAEDGSILFTFSGAPVIQSHEFRYFQNTIKELHKRSPERFENMHQDNSWVGAIESDGTGIVLG